MDKKEKPVFEDVFNLIGHIGCFQICLYLFGCIIEISVCLSVLFYTLEYANPGWTCAPYQGNATGDTYFNSTSLGVQQKNFTEFENNVSLSNVCPKDGSTRCTNLTYSDEYTSISTDWDFICDRRYLGPLTASLYFVGVLVGSCASGYFSDNFGRKRTTLVMWILLIVTQAISGFSTVWEMYLPFRILAGIMAGGCSTVAMILPMEYFGPRYRVIASNRIGWQIGGLILPLVGYLTRKWQHVAIACGLLMAPFVPFFAYFMPESARWLMQKGRTNEAKDWIKHIAKCNRKSEPDLSVLDVIAETENAAALETEEFTYLDLFRTKKYAFRTSVLFLAWFDISLISYGIGADMGALTGSIYLNLAILSLCLLALEWMTIPIANKIGRLKTYTLYKTGLMLCMVVTMSLSLIDNKKYAVHITAMVLFSFVWQSGVWALVFVFATEAFPTLLRSRATAIGNIASRLAGIIAPQIGLLTVHDASIPYVIYLTVGVTTIILVYVIIPETNNRPMIEDLPWHKKGKGQGDTNGYLKDGLPAEKIEMLTTTI